MAKDIDNACACFSSPLREQLRKDIEELILGNYQLFEGYQDVKMRSINVQMGKLDDTAEYGGEIYSVNKLEILAHWIGLAMLLIGGMTWFTLRRRRARN